MNASKRNAAGALALLLLSMAPVSALATPPQGGAGTDDGSSAAVTASGPAASPLSRVKSKLLYFHNDSQSIGGATRDQTANTTLGGTQSVIKFGRPPQPASITVDFYQFPAMTRAATVNGTVSAIVWLRSTQSNNMFITLTLTVLTIDPAGVTTTRLAGTGVTYDPVTTHFSEYRATAGPGVFTVPAGHNLVFRVTMAGDASRDIFVAWGDATYRSRAVLPMETHLKVASAVTMAANRTVQTSFDPSATTPEVIFNATVEDPLGGYDVRYANLSLEGPAGQELLRAPMARVWGSASSRYVSFELTWNYSGRPVGRYNFTVEAVDNTGYNARYPDDPGDTTYGGHLETFTGTFYIGTAPVPVHVRALDSRSRPLGGTLVAIRATGSFFVDINRTDGGGDSQLVCPLGAYRFIVFWQGIEVYNQSHTITGPVNSSSPLVFVSAVYDATLRVVDVANAPLAGALVFLRHPNSTALPALGTSSTGESSISRMAGGVYGVRVDFRGIDVAVTTLNLNSNALFVIPADVYYLRVTVRDLAGAPLPGAQVILRDNVTDIISDSRITNATGLAVSRLPKHVYDVEVRWLESVVNLTYGLAIAGNASLAITALVYQVSLRLLDSRSAPVEAARVDLALSTGKVIITAITGADGRVGLQAPGGVFRLTATWRNVRIHDDPAFSINASGPRDVMVGVYYVGFTVADGADKTVSGAIIRVTSGGKPVDSNTSGLDGKASMRLPTTAHDGPHLVEVWWLGAKVHSAPLNVTADAPVKLVVDILYVVVTVSDSRSQAVDGAVVEASHAGSLVSTAATGADGKATLRLPKAPIRFEVTWLGVGVHDSTVNVTGAPVPLSASVYYLKVTLVDSRSQPVQGALLRYITPAGVEITEVSTGADGVAEARAPGGKVEVAASWYRTEVHRSEVALAADVAVSLTAKVYYLALTIVDSRSKPVAFAELVAQHKGELVGSATTTSPDGKATLRLPVGDSSVIAHWFGVKVLDATQTISADSSAELKAAVFYVQARPQDSRNLPLADAQVEGWVNGALAAAGVTDPSGSAELRVPGASIEFRASWKGVQVLKDSKDVSGDAALILPSKVYYLKVKVVGHDGGAVPDAEASVFRGAVVATNFTRSDGAAEFRLPAETYDVKVRYRAAYYLSPVDSSASKSGIVVAGDMQVDVALADYPPPLHATGTFAVALLFVLILVFGILLLWLALRKKGGATLPGEEKEGAAEEAKKDSVEKDEKPRDLEHDETGGPTDASAK